MDRCRYCGSNLLSDYDQVLMALRKVRSEGVMGSIRVSSIPYEREGHEHEYFAPNGQPQYDADRNLTAPLYFSYGPTTEVARKLIAAFTEFGLEVKWEGHIGNAVKVLPRKKEEK